MRGWGDRRLASWSRGLRSVRGWARGLQSLATVSRVFAQVDSLSAAMTFQRERLGVLAGNLANQNTPGYRSLDLARELGTSGGQMLRTDPRHLPGGGPDRTTVIDDGGSLNGPDGNTVSLERELAKIDGNRVRYQGAAELVTRRLALLRYAAGDGNG
jgi:flagellar basal-body rod protein FlgB